MVQQPFQGNHEFGHKCVFSPCNRRADAFEVGKIFDANASLSPRLRKVCLHYQGLGTNLSFVGNSVVDNKHNSGFLEIYFVAIMLGNKLAKSSSITSEYTPGLLSKYNPPRSVARSPTQFSYPLLYSFSKELILRLPLHSFVLH